MADNKKPIISFDGSIKTDHGTTLVPFEVTPLNPDGSPAGEPRQEYFEFYNESIEDIPTVEEFEAGKELKPLNNGKPINIIEAESVPSKSDNVRSVSTTHPDKPFEDSEQASSEIEKS